MMGVVFHLDRALDCAPQLQAFLAQWQDEGPFPIVIPPEGGLRYGPYWEEWQLDAYERGATRARGLEETPHGRGGAVDVYPALTLGARCIGALMDWDSGNGKDAYMFRELGARAKAFGLVWGGSWGFQDACHIEILNWRSLPFPPFPPLKENKNV